MDVAVIVAWPPLTDTTWPAALTVAMYVLLDVQVVVVVALPVTVAVRPWCRSGVSNVYDDSLRVIATGPTTVSVAPPSSVVVPVSGAASVPGSTVPVSGPASLPACCFVPPHAPNRRDELEMTTNRERKWKRLLMVSIRVVVAAGGRRGLTRR